MAQKFEYTVLELIESASRNIRALPLNLGGVGGAAGGLGGPPGGLVGWLPQTRVAYDQTEDATLDTAPSGYNPPSGWSLVDNLNHIRYRLNQLEAGSGILVVDDVITTVENVSQITFSGAIVTDLGGGHALVQVLGSGGSGTPTGTPDRIAIFDEGGNLNTDNDLFYDSVNQVFAFGPFRPSVGTLQHAMMHTAQSGISTGFVQFAAGMLSTTAPFHTFFRSYGDLNSPLAVLDGAVVGRVRGRPHDGSAWENTQVEMRYVVVGDHDASNHGTKVEFYTTPSGSATLTKVLDIGSDGNINIETGKTYNIGGVPHSHAGGSIIFQRTLSENLTLNDGECLVIAGYIDADIYDITLNGDATLHIA